MVSDSSELCLSTLLASEACDSDFSSSSALLSPCCPCTIRCCKHEHACSQVCRHDGIPLPQADLSERTCSVWQLPCRAKYTMHAASVNLCRSLQHEMMA